MPLARITGLFGTQKTPADLRVVPPAKAPFSWISTLAPPSWAKIAAGHAAAPLPTTSTSTLRSQPASEASPARSGDAVEAARPAPRLPTPAARRKARREIRDRVGSTRAWYHQHSRDGP